MPDLRQRRQRKNAEAGPLLTRLRCAMISRRSAGDTLRCTSRLSKATARIRNRPGRSAIARRGHVSSTSARFRRCGRRRTFGCARSEPSRSSPRATMRRAAPTACVRRHGRMRIKEHLLRQASEASLNTCLGIFHGKARLRAGVGPRLSWMVHGNKGEYADLDPRS